MVELILVNSVSRLFGGQVESRDQRLFLLLILNAPKVIQAKPCCINRLACSGLNPSSLDIIFYFL